MHEHSPQDVGLDWKDVDALRAAVAARRSAQETSDWLEDVLRQTAGDLGLGGSGERSAQPR